MVAPVGSAPAQAWDGRLSGWPGANLLQSFAWGEVQAQAGWETHRIRVETSSGELPISVQIGASGIPGLPRVYVARGPVCDPQDLDGFAAAVAQLEELGLQRHALAVELEVPWEEGSVPEGHPWLSWPRVAPRQPLSTSLVDLRPEPEQIMASFHSKARYNVRLAERRGVEVEEARELSGLVDCLRATEERQRIHLPSPSHLELVRQELGEAVRVLLAEVDGEVVAAMMTASFGGHCVYLYGGSTGSHRELMPNQLLQWRAMLLARQMGCVDYDLWGIPESQEPDHPWHGLFQFKRGFGGREIRYAGARSLQLRLGGRSALALVDSLRHRARTRGRR